MRLLDTYLQLLVELLNDEHTAYHKQVLRTIAQAAAYECLSYLEDHISVLPEEKTKGKSDIMRRFVLLVREHGTIHHNVQWYASQLAITPKYLSVISKKESGYTALDIIHKVTNEEILKLLKTSSLTIKEIAFRLRFSDASQFGRYVRLNFGQTPTQIRTNA